MERDKEKIQLVIDTNILISALLKDDSLTANLIKSDSLKIFYPDYGLIEIEHYKKHINSKREKQLQQKSLDYILKFVLESIEIIPSQLYIQKMKEAFELIRDFDEKDTPFLALALQLNCPIWSNDKHLKKQKAVKTYSTKDIIKGMKI